MCIDLGREILSSWSAIDKGDPLVDVVAMAEWIVSVRLPGLLGFALATDNFRFRLKTTPAGGIAQLGAHWRQTVALLKAFSMTGVT